MIIGTPTEVKTNETRVAMTPNWARRLTAAGHEVWVQKDAGKNSGFSNEDYEAAGVKIADTAKGEGTPATGIRSLKGRPDDHDMVSSGRGLR